MAPIAEVPTGRLPDGSPCNHEGETSTYCTRCWMNLYEARMNPAQRSGRRSLQDRPSEEQKSNPTATETRDVMAHARAQLKGHWGAAVGITMVYWLIAAVFGTAIGILAFVGQIFLHLPAGGVAVVQGILGLVIGAPLLVGLSRFFLALIRGGEARVEQLFDGFSTFGSSVIAYLLVGLLTLLWSLLLIVPGILAALSYSMTFFVLADNKETAGLEAIRRSKAMMQGQRWKLFCLGCRFVGWSLLGTLTFGIGFLWIVPYWMSSVANFYDQVRGPAEPARMQAAV